MTITLQQARPLCTKSELELVHWSTAKRVEGLDATRLRQKLTRARKLRDKFRDLGDSQKRQIRGKEGRAAKGGPAQDNRNTRMKQQLFAETVERFEAALAKAESAGAQATTKKTKKKTGKKVAKKAAEPAKKSAKKTGKKKVSKKAAASASSPNGKTTEKVAKKAGKKVAKKAASKKTAKRGSSLLGKETPAATTALSPEKKVAIKKILASKEKQQNNITLTTVSAEILPKTKAKAIDKGGAKRLQGHISARGRRTQAKRDAR